MRTLVHFVRHGGYSDSEMIALGWGATVFIPGLFAAAGLLMLIAWVLVLITEMLVGERSLAFYYLVTIPIFVFAAGIAILAVSACRIPLVTA